MAGDSAAPSPAASESDRLNTLTRAFDRRAVGDYYDRMTPWYHFGYSGIGLHYGLWEPGTRNLRQAILRAKDFLFDTLGPFDASRDHILDAGCGSGWTSLYFARRSGARVTGITVSSRQADQANRRARAQGKDDRVCFRVADFCGSDLPAGQFTHAFATESSCYAQDKRDFLREMHRLLKPGGRLVIADLYPHQPPERMPARHRFLYEEFCNGFAVPNLPCWETMQQYITDAGFRLTGNRDLTPRVMKTARSIQQRGIISMAPALLLRLVRVAPPDLVPHLRACIHQREFFRDAARYRMLTLER